MSTPNEPSGRPPFIWLGLLLFATIAFFAGQLLGNIPNRTTPATETPAATTVPGAGGAIATTESSDGELHWRWYSEAMEESRRTGKPVLIDFNADWCPPCQRMKREVFQNSDIARGIEASVVAVSVVDANGGEAASGDEELRRRFTIKAYPTLVVLNPKTGQSVQHRGYGNADNTRQWIAAAVQQVR